MNRFLLTIVLLVSLCGTCFAYDANTKLLAHFDVAHDGSDEMTAATGQTITCVETADASDVQFKWTKSLLLDGNSDYATVPDDMWAELGNQRK